jgi:hypothetical protein
MGKGGSRKAGPARKFFASTIFEEYDLTGNFPCRKDKPDRKEKAARKDDKRSDK